MHSGKMKKYWFFNVPVTGCVSQKEVTCFLFFFFVFPLFKFNSSLLVLRLTFVNFYLFVIEGIEKKLKIVTFTHIVLGIFKKNSKTKV